MSEDPTAAAQAIAEHFEQQHATDVENGAAAPDAAAPEDSNKRPRDGAEVAADDEQASKRANEGMQAPVDPAPGGATAGGLTTAFMDCPENLVGKLIGRKGDTIQWLEKDTGCRIQVDHKTPSENKKVTITAENEQKLEHAKARIQEVLDSEGPINEAEVTVDCPPGIVGRIIGRGGETIKSLQLASNAKIMVDQNFPEGENRKVHLSGRSDNVERARKMVEELINGEPGSAQAVIAKCLQYGNGITETMECPKNMVGKVIGKGGETIKALQRNTQCNIQINQEIVPCVITITGAPKSVQDAKRQVMDIVSGTSAFGAGSGAMGGYGGAPGAFNNGGAYGQPQFPPQQQPPYGYGGYGAHAGYPPQQYGGYGGYGAPQQQYGGYQAPQQQPAYGANAGYGQQAGYPDQSSGYGAQQPSAGYGGARQQGYGAQPAAGSSDWQECHDDQGRPYYYNSKTGQSQWEKPAEMA